MTANSLPENQVSLIYPVTTMMSIADNNFLIRCRLDSTMEASAGSRHAEKLYP